MRSSCAFIGVGSNLGESLMRIQVALEHLDRASNIRLRMRSRIYRNPPMGPVDQPDYFNAVVAVETALAPENLLAELWRIEALGGRRREMERVRWGPRSLDLDLLLYDDEVIRSDILSVPHPGLMKRIFVVRPLLEICPDVFIPGHGLLRSMPLPSGAETLVAVDEAETDEDMKMGLG
ncbi:2-amino-4-hydroxy-6-hydroxymethyldihydropteridine diphosphokinase [Thioalkalivibrio sp. HK1]|uniref:2-amino-4-hydroxy-6- hydroxymethyldihydropteridine diphosphokinase n=1 Tax=Thioalkalivibrio sp. HK1 TaxID=1469245 RepID=UPI00046F9B0F|nr:2-amino-4-hydroxy-6-hydroxymethyldihydropteridine diphosphokinase [Thioalkalivibrio sp. HK1]